MVLKVYEELKAMSDRLDKIKPKEKAALAKKDIKQEKWKYQSWNGKTKPDKEPLMTYIDRIERDFPDKK